MSLLGWSLRLLVPVALILLSSCSTTVGGIPKGFFKCQEEPAWPGLKSDAELVSYIEALRASGANCRDVVHGAEGLSK